MNDNNVDSEMLKQLEAFVEFMKNKNFDITEIKDKTVEPETIKKGPGRPKGSRKRKEETTSLTVTVTEKDKKFIKETAQEENMSMADFIAYLVDKERTRRERLNQ